MSSSLLHKASLTLCTFLSLSVAGSLNVCAADLQTEASAVPVFGKVKVALIVTPESSPLTPALAPFRAGVEAAYEEDSNKFELVKYEATDKTDVINILNKAADEKAMLVIGPVLKNSVEQIAALPYLPLPVIAINRTDNEVQPELFMSIDVAVESEIEQLVKVAIENTVMHPSGNFVILSTPGEYDERIARSIRAELEKQGMTGEIRHISTEQLAYITTEMRGKNFRGCFFAMNPQQASLIRPYLPPELAVFGTSYTNPYRSNDTMASQTQANDLNGMVTLEIPAITQLDQENYLKYRPLLLKLNNDARHLFAVGVDTWQLGKQWLEWNQSIEIKNGLSGDIHFDKKQSSRALRKMDKTVVKPSRSLEDDVAFEENAEEAGL